MKPTVLFTGGGGAGSEALARLLADRYDVHFADADPDARPHGIAPDRWHQILPASDPDFVAALVYLCSEIGADLLVPGVDEELERVVMVRNLFASVLLPPRSFVVAHLDKLTSYELLRDADIPVPLTVGGGLFPETPLPWVIKPRRGRGSRGVAVVRDGHQAARHRILFHNDHYIVQEFIEGDEYTVTVAADATGRLRAIVPCKIALKRGITIRARTHHDSAVIETCQKIHEAHPVPGCYNVQGIKTADGFKVFEINPRVSTTLCLAIAAGVDPIAVYLGHSGTIPASVPRVEAGDGLVSFTEGLGLARSWHNEFVA